MTKEYICECGKSYTYSQAFNGHKRHCKIHLQKTGKLDKMLEADNRARMNLSEAIRKHSKEQITNSNTYTEDVV